MLITRRGGAEVLLFAHPHAGWQIVKGTVEPGETPALAARREFLEETGHEAPLLTARGSAQPSADRHWFYFHGAGDALPEGWVHHCTDDGGQDYRFFWHRLGDPAPELADIYVAALGHLP